jgi:hypothetical protein
MASRRVVASLTAALLLTGIPSVAGATPLPTTTEVQDFLIIGTGPGAGSPTIDVGQATDTSNYELGANKAPVPSTSDFLDSGGGPGLAGNVPDIDNDANTVEIDGNDVGIEHIYQGISGDGDVAITEETGKFSFSNTGVYADQGVHCAGTVANCEDGTSNSFFNDPNQFPNTFDPNTDTGIFVGPGDADQSTRMDDPNLAGILGMQDFSILEGELSAMADAIAAATGTGELDVSGNSGKISDDLLFNLSPGVNIIDVVTGGGVDFLIENSNLVIDGPAGAFAVFRVPDDANMLISQANILAGDGGIGLTSIVFYSDRPDNDTHFGFSKTVINGIAFWDLGPFLGNTIDNFGGGISIDNAQGCTQLIADKVSLQDVRFTRCAAVVPEPNTFGLTAIGLLGLTVVGTRARRRPRAL